MATNNGMQSIRNNRSLLRKRDTFNKLKGMIRKESSSTQIKLSKSENRKIRLELDKERLISDHGRNLANAVVLIIAIIATSIFCKIIQFYLF